MVMLAPTERKSRILKGISLLEQATEGMLPPLIDLIVKEYGKDPFLILISCLLSLRARDTFTITICHRLFAHIRTPEELVKLSIEELQTLLRPLNFYRKKAFVLHEVCTELLNRFNGKVPQTEEELLSLKGVGRKTATLVLGQAFDIPAICVDTHVHRVSNRLGWVQTTKPQDTEEELKKVVPRDKWIKLNYLLVVWGQNICVPISPLCSRCVLFSLCPKIGVTKRR
jgi:endonuclease III